MSIRKTTVCSRDGSPLTVFGLKTATLLRHQVSLELHQQVRQGSQPAKHRGNEPAAGSSTLKTWPFGPRLSDLHFRRRGRRCNFGEHITPRATRFYEGGTPNDNLQVDLHNMVTTISLTRAASVRSVVRSCPSLNTKTGVNQRPVHPASMGELSAPALESLISPRRT